jgi:pyridoxamine 5'-phosphate oxidase
MAEAGAAGDPDPTAMSLATADIDGRVAVRIVLLKAAAADGFVFYTNTLSDKGRELARNPHAALCFHWKTLRDGVQVRIEGRTAPVSAPEADAYFASRPRESQIGAWASEQSTAIAERAVLERRVQEFSARYAGAAVPRPPHWSGYRLDPGRIEFWFGMPHRLHERERWDARDGAWHRTLLSP